MPTAHLRASLPSKLVQKKKKYVVENKKTHPRVLKRRKNGVGHKMEILGQLLKL